MRLTVRHDAPSSAPSVAERGVDTATMSPSAPSSRRAVVVVFDIIISSSTPPIIEEGGGGGAVQEVSIIIIISTDCVRLSLAGLAVAVIILFLVVGGLNWCPLLFRGYLYAFPPKKDGRLKKRQAQETAGSHYRRC